MQDLPHRRATYADLLAAPPNLVAELIAGELFTQPRPRNRQANTYSVLGGILNPRFQLGTGGPGGWWIVDEPELHLNDDILVPDLGGWRRERMPELADAAYFDLAPDWVCEIVSPSTAKHDRGAKRDIYGRNGVRHIWHVDPDAHLLEAFELDDNRWVLLRAYKDNELVDAAPFGAASFELGLLWAG